MPRESHLVQAILREFGSDPRLKMEYLALR